MRPTEKTPEGHARDPNAPDEHGSKPEYLADDAAEHCPAGNHAAGECAVARAHPGEHAVGRDRLPDRHDIQACAACWSSPCRKPPSRMQREHGWREVALDTRTRARPALATARHARLGCLRCLAVTSGRNSFARPPSRSRPIGSSSHTPPPRPAPIPGSGSERGCACRPDAARRPPWRRRRRGPGLRTIPARAASGRTREASPRSAHRRRPRLPRPRVDGRLTQVSEDRRAASPDAFASSFDSASAIRRLDAPAPRSSGDGRPSSPLARRRRIAPQRRRSPRVISWDVTVDGNIAAFYRLR